MSEDKKNNTGQDNSGYGNSGYGNSGNRNSGDWNSGNRNSGDWNSGDWNSGDWNSGDWNSGDGNSGNGNSGDRNSGYGNSGYGNSGYGNSGYGNSGNRNSGIFCSTEPKIRMFNKETDLLWSEIDHPSFYEFYLNKWISEDDMTDQEKLENPKFFTTKGYLKNIPWLEAWATYWEKSDKEEKDKVLNLPNFDAEIFKEITGIDVHQAKDILVVEGKRYKLIREDEGGE